MVHLLLYVLCAAIALSALYYIITHLVPEPMRGFAMVVLVVLCAVVLIWILMSFDSGAAAIRLPK